MKSFFSFKSLGKNKLGILSWMDKADNTLTSKDIADNQVFVLHA